MSSGGFYTSRFLSNRRGVLEAVLQIPDYSLTAVVIGVFLALAFIDLRTEVPLPVLVPNMEGQLYYLLPRYSFLQCSYLQNSSGCNALRAETFVRRPCNSLSPIY